MKILFLGTSGAGVTTTRNPPSILIDQSILIDCGEGTLHSLLTLHHSPLKLRAIFLTHLHADHCLGLVSLLWYLAIYAKPHQKFTKDRFSPSIYVPEGYASNIQNLLTSTYSPFASVRYIPKILELPTLCSTPILVPKKKSLDYTTDSYSIEWLPMIHKPLNYAYKINKQVVISGDSAPHDPLISFAQNCSLLIHEATLWDHESKLCPIINHSTPLAAALIAKKAHVKSLILTHLPDLNSEEVQKFISDAQICFPSINIAIDGWKINIEEY